MDPLVDRFRGDRRLFKRYLLKTAVRVRVWKSPLPELRAESINLSQRGIFFLSDTEFHRGDAIEVLLKMPTEITGEPATEWRCTGLVVRVQPLDSPIGRLGIGVRFDGYEVSRLSSPAEPELSVPYVSITHDQYGATLDPTGQRYLQGISDAGHRMSILLDDLIRLAQVTHQGLTLAHVQLRPIVDEVLTDTASETQGRDIEWRISKLPLIRCDRRLMKQVLVNLISSAIKYTRPRPQAIIEVGQAVIHRQSAFFVRDNGVGFDMSSAVKLCAPFERLHRDADFEGTGIGLAAVQRIIEKHKGRVWAVSDPTPQTTFYFTLWETESVLQRLARVHTN